MAQLRKPTFIKQVVRNACGTMALLHSVVNVVELTGGAFPEGSFLQRLGALAKEGKSPEELAAFMNEDAELDQVQASFAP